MTALIRVEFYGIPRTRAGVQSVEVAANSLGEVCRQLGVLLPELGRDCLHEDRLKSGFIANINGTEFTTNPEHALHPGDCVLVLSSDVGG